MAWDCSRPGAVEAAAASKWRSIWSSVRCVSLVVDRQPRARRATSRIVLGGVVYVAFGGAAGQVRLRSARRCKQIARRGRRRRPRRRSAPHATAPDTDRSRRATSTGPSQRPNRLDQEAPTLTTVTPMTARPDA